MNLREAKKLQSGAIVRQSFQPVGEGYPTINGLVLGKSHVREQHTAAILGGVKEERYDIVIHWLCEERDIPGRYHNERAKDDRRLQVRENWELMVVSHATS